jgi:hypothetical protein
MLHLSHGHQHSADADDARRRQPWNWREPSRSDVVLAA